MGLWCGPQTKSRLMSQAHPLSQPNFRLFFGAQSASYLGNAIAPLSLSFAILAATGQPLYVGWALAAYLIPNLFALQVGGVTADRYSRSAQLAIANVLAAAFQAGVALSLLVAPFRLELLLVMMVLSGCAVGFSSPASRGVVPDLVPGPALRPAYSLISGVRSGSRILGPTLAGIFAASGNAVWGVIADAAGFLIAGVLYTILHMRLPHQPATHVAASGDGWKLRVGELWRESVAGWVYIRSTRWLLWSVLAAAVTNFCLVGPKQVLLPGLADGRDQSWELGVLFSALALGGLLGASIFYVVRVSRFLLLGTVLGAFSNVALVVFVVGTPLWVLITCGVAGGILSCAAESSFEATFGAHVPAELRSRVGSAEMMLSFGVIPASQLAMAPLAGRFGATTIVLFLAGVYVLASLLPVLSRDYRTMTVS